jgi:hypothetical protein
MQSGTGGREGGGMQKRDWPVDLRDVTPASRHRDGGGGNMKGKKERSRGVREKRKNEG